MTELNITPEQYEKAAEAAWRATYRGPFLKGSSGADHCYQVVRAAAPHLQSQPLPVSGDLVERMIAAYSEGAAFPKGTPEGIAASQAKGMAAALRVAAEELLAEPTNAELDAVEHSWIFDQLPSDVAQKVRDAACVFISNRRRARMFTPPTDPAVEAVMQVFRERGWCESDVIEGTRDIVAAVRKADKEQA